MTDQPEGTKRDLHELLEVAAELHDVSDALKKILRPTVYQDVRFWAGLAAAMTANVGLVLFFGSPRRISSNAYALIAHYGGHFVWGLAFIVTALVTTLCAWQFVRLVRWALLIQALPYAAIATSFAIAAVQYPDANLTAAPVYCWITIMHACLSDYARREL